MKAEPMAPSLPYSICCRLPKDLLLVPKLLYTNSQGEVSKGSYGGSVLLRY